MRTLYKIFPKTYIFFAYIYTIIKYKKVLLNKDNKFIFVSKKEYYKLLKLNK